MSRKDRKSKKEEAVEESVEELYDETERTLSHEDAFRDHVYKLPGRIAHIKACYMVQMKSYTKQKTVWLMAILLIIIPIAFFIGKFEAVDGVANTLMSVLLSLLPVMSVLLATTACGTMLPAEFNERTVYLSLPLPMSRFDFYLGKFLAGFTLTSSVIIAAYGVSMLLSMIGGNPMYVDPMLESLALALSGMFFYCALTYMLSASSKRSATLKTLLFAIVGLPLLALGLAYLSDYAGISALSTISKHFPSFSMDMAVYYLGTPLLPFGESAVLLGSSSIYGLFNMTMLTSFLSFEYTFVKNGTTMCIICVVIGVLLFIRGYRKISRRDM